MTKTYDGLKDFEVSEALWETVWDDALLKMKALYTEEGAAGRGSATTDTIMYARQLDSLPKSLGTVGAKFAGVSKWKEDAVDCIVEMRERLLNPYVEIDVANVNSFFEELQAEYEEYIIEHPGVSYEEWYDIINRMKT